MTYQPHAYLSWGGPLGGDVWSCGIRMTDTFYQNLTIPQRFDYCDAVIDDLATVLGGYVSSNPAINAGALITWVKFNPIAGDGKYENEQTIVRYWRSASPLGAGGGGMVAPQLALAVTLGTSVDRGLAARGRIFWPSGIAAVGPTGEASDAPIQQFATVQANFIQALNGASAQADPTVATVCSVLSNKTRPGQTGAGPARPVTRIRVGHAIDTQRRRRNKVRENYVEKAVGAP